VLFASPSLFCRWNGDIKLNGQIRILRFRKGALLLLSVNSVINSQTWVFPAIDIFLTKNGILETQHSLRYCWRRGPNIVLNPAVQISGTEGFHSLLCTSYEPKLSISFPFMVLSTFLQGISVTMQCFLWERVLPSRSSDGFEWLLRELQTRMSVYVWGIFLQDCVTASFH
jgi:hypothetical protein